MQTKKVDITTICGGAGPGSLCPRLSGDRREHRRREHGPEKVTSNHDGLRFHGEMWQAEAMDRSQAWLTHLVGGIPVVA